MNIEYRNAEGIEATNTDDNKQQLIKGVAVVFDEPQFLYEYDGQKYYECILKGAFDGCDLSDVLLRYNHNDNTPILARGGNNTLVVSVNDEALEIIADIADTQTGKDIYKLIDNRTITGLSIGFVVDKDYYLNNIRYIEKISKIIEISIVDIPAYKNTSIETVKRSFDKLQEEQTNKKLKLKLLTYF